MDEEKEAEFMRLFVSHEPELRAFLRTLLPSWEIVDDVLQEGSVVMWKKLDQLEDEMGFLPWAKVILRFKALNARRTAARDRLFLSEDTVTLLADEGLGFAPGQVDLERSALDSCLQKLSDDHRSLVLLPYRESGGLKAFAQKNGRSANSLYKLLGRLREKLRVCVERELMTEGGQP